MISASEAPENTGVAVLVNGSPERASSPRFFAQSGSPSIVQPCAATHPRWVSRIWPMFIRRGTPCGFSTMSTGVPSGRKGMSSAGRILPMTPLLPCRPASLSPSWIFRFWAT